MHAVLPFKTWVFYFSKICLIFSGIYKKIDKENEYTDSIFR